jgi:hypothetical protein
MGHPNAMSNNSVQQNKKKTSNYAKTLAEIKSSLSQFERTDLARTASAASTTSNLVNCMMALDFDEVGDRILITTQSYQTRFSLFYTYL